MATLIDLHQVEKYHLIEGNYNIIKYASHNDVYIYNGGLKEAG